MTFDIPSILWMNSFTLNLQASLNLTNLSSPTPSTGTKSQFSSSSSISYKTDNVQTTKENSVKMGTSVNESNTIRDGIASPVTQPSPMYMDVKLEAIMPRLVIELPIDLPHQKDRPKCMQIQISRLALTNIREMGSSRADLAQAIHSLQEGSLVFGNGFPSKSTDMCIVTDRILAHIAAADNITGLESSSPDSEVMSGDDVIPSVSKSVSIDYLTRYAMWSEPRDIWCINLDPVWIDFLGARSLGAKNSIPFIDAVPITIWLHNGHRNDLSKNAEDLFSVKFQNPINNFKNCSNSANIKNHNYNEKAYRSNPFIDSEEDIYFNRRSQASSTTSERSADLHAILHISNLVSVQLDHYQYLFLLRLAEEITEMTSFLALDAERIPHKVKKLQYKKIAFSV